MIMVWWFFGYKFEFYLKKGFLGNHQQVARPGTAELVVRHRPGYLVPCW